MVVGSPGSNTVLVMVDEGIVARDLEEYLSGLRGGEEGKEGRGRRRVDRQLRR